MKLLKNMVNSLIGAAQFTTIVTITVVGTLTFITFVHYLWLKMWEYIMIGVENVLNLF